MSSDNNARNSYREGILNDLYNERQEIMLELATPEMQKDVSENGPRDILLARLSTLEYKIHKIESGQLAPYIPGTYNSGDKLLITFERIVTFGKDQPVPKHPITVELVDFYDITELPSKIDLEEMTDFKVAVSSKMGQALINKAHSQVKYNTNDGFCEISIQRL